MNAKRLIALIKTRSKEEICFLKVIALGQINYLSYIHYN